MVRKLAFIVCVTALGALAVSVVADELPGSDPAAVVDAHTRNPDIEFVIPRGTAARLARGERVTTLPSPLVVHVGDTLRIRNLDTSFQYVGPFFVAAHATVTERFTTPGVLRGTCELHPSGRLTIRVLE